MHCYKYHDGIDVVRDDFFQLIVLEELFYENNQDMNIQPTFI